MNWISVSDRLPEDRQRVLVWYPSEWQEAEYFADDEDDDDEDEDEDEGTKYKGSFATINRNDFGGVEDIFKVEYWAEVIGPKTDAES